MKWFIIMLILLAMGVVGGVGYGLSLAAWNWLGWIGVVPIGLVSIVVAGYAVWYGIGMLACITLGTETCVRPITRNQSTSENHLKKH